MNLNAAAVASSSDVTHQVFLIAGWRTWRELNPHPLSRTRERDLAGHTSFDSFPDYRSANQAEGGQTPSADAESAVSGSHKPRLPKFKLPGLPRSITLGTGTRRPRSATTYTVGAGSTAGGANFARLLRRFAAAVVVGLKDGFHPLSAASCGNRKEPTPLSDHAFVRSMVRVWCHLRHQAEKLAPSTKAFTIITLTIKKCNNISEYFYISPASRSFSNCNIPL